MDLLSRNMDAYVRPSPTKGALGGINRQTSEAIALCEGAGYDIVVVETVGVGQSETLVDNMVDMFVLLCPPGAGDELQGIKRGIMEMVDLVIVTKADGPLEKVARQAKSQIRNALHLQRPKHQGWQAQVIATSAVEGVNVDAAFDAMREFKEEMQASGEWQARRAIQRETWMWTQVQEDLRRRLETDGGVQNLLEQFKPGLEAGEVAPREAAKRVVDAFLESASGGKAARG